MATRTRSQTRLIPQQEIEAQTKITDVFKATRRGTKNTKSPKSNLLETKNCSPPFERKPKTRSTSAPKKSTRAASKEKKVMEVDASISSIIKELSPMIVEVKKRAASKEQFSFPSPVKQKEASENMHSNDQCLNKNKEAEDVIKLSEDVLKNKEFDLPNKYENLLKKFHQMDRIVSILHGRGSRCESSDILRNVQKNINLDFTRLHLAQIVAVYTYSYSLTLEEQRNLAGNLNGHYDLILKPNLADDLKNFIKEPSNADKVIAIKLEGWRMKFRMKIMRHLLAERVKECHKRFVESTSNDAVEGVIRFDPNFLDRLNEECDDIEPVVLPEPQKKVPNCKNVEKFLKSLNSLEVEVRELKLEGPPIRKNPPKTEGAVVTKPPKIYAVKNLLERIRQKEALKKEAEEKRDPEVEHRNFCIELLHTKLLRPLLNLFVLKSCRSIQMAQILEKMVTSTSRNRGEVMECLEFLCEIAPSFSKITEITSNKYLQIEKNAHQCIRDLVREAFESGKPGSELSK